MAISFADKSCRNHMNLILRKFDLEELFATEYEMLPPREGLSSRDGMDDLSRQRLIIVCRKMLEQRDEK